MNKEFLEDLIKAQREIKPIPKSGKNLHFRSEYAEYDEVIERVKAVLNKYNMFITHRMLDSHLHTEIWHATGEYLFSSMPLLNKAGTDQGLGSSITYAKRYTTISLVAGATGDDDDGHKATHHAPITQAYMNPINDPANATLDTYLQEELPPFDALPAPTKTADGRFKIPETVLAKIKSGDTMHRDGDAEHRWNANKKYPGTFYCSKKLVDNTFCKEQRVEP